MSLNRLCVCRETNETRLQRLHEDLSHIILKKKYSNKIDREFYTRKRVLGQ